MQCLAKARKRGVNPKTGRECYFIQCNICKKWFPQNQIKVDHIDPVTPVDMTRLHLTSLQRGCIVVLVTYRTYVRRITMQKQNEKTHLENLLEQLESLKIRVEQDENMYLKIQESANRQHVESLNQLADLFRLVRRQQEQIDKLKGA
jgi:hypothetical protein